MLAIEERGQTFWTIFEATIFLKQLLRYAVFLLQFLKVKTAVCNTENVSRNAIQLEIIQSKQKPSTTEFLLPLY